MGFRNDFLVFLNPSCKYPYSEELKNATSKGHGNKLQHLQALLIKKQLPREPLKYQHKHANDWYTVLKVYKACITFEPKNRPSATEVLIMIDQEASVSSMDLHLKVTQATALKDHDGYVAQIVQQHGEVPCVCFFIVCK